MSTLIRVLADFTRMALADVLARANAVYAGLNGNPAYSNPPVPLPEFRKAIDDYSAALTAALDGGSKAIAQRNAAGETLRRMLRKLAHYVEAACNDDMTTFTSSGFLPLIRTPGKRHSVSEAIRKIVAGTVSGELLVGLVKTPGAVSYELRWAPVSAAGSPAEWRNLPIANTRDTSVAGLTPGTTYVFQSRALTKSGLTDWSDSVTRTCT